jgi:hypothetical protein
MKSKLLKIGAGFRAQSCGFDLSGHDDPNEISSLPIAGVRKNPFLYGTPITA